MRKLKYLKKSMLACGLVVAVILSGCGKQNPDNTNDGNTEAVSEDALSENESESETEEADYENESTTTDNTEENNYTNLDILIQNKSHTDFSNDDKYNTIYSGNYDLIHLSDESKEAYPELSKALEKYNEEKETAFLTAYEQYKDEALNWYEDMGEEDYFNGYSDENRISIGRSDDQFLSIIDSSSTYTGGAHGFYGCGGYNYDVKTGQELKLKDVINDIASLQAIVKEKLTEEYEGAPFLESIDETVPEYLTGEEDQACSWFLTPQGVDIYFGIYMLGSYAEGTQTVHILYTEHPELFFEGFHIQEGDYIESFAIYENFYTDIDNDGTMDSLCVEPEYDEYDNMTNMVINVNDKQTSVEGYGFNVSPSVVHIDGKTFLYIDVTTENDYRTTYAVSLNSDGAKLIEQYNGYITGKVPDADYEAEWASYWSVAYTSPDNLYFGDRMQLLSTYDGIAKASIDSSGKLNVDEYYYANIYGDYGKLTVKETIKGCSKVDPDTLEQTDKDVAISAGTVLTIYGTNGKDFVDLSDESGTLYRVRVDYSDWPQKVNDRDIEEMFDGMMFAG